MPPAELAALRQPVPLNRASEQELTSLPRVGPVLARRIVESRPFASVDELLRVRGIGPVTLERLRPRVRIDDSAP
ncbi:MAG: helix-hairpin-helix domain-containing protein [Nannocystaceae bacterium]